MSTITEVANGIGVSVRRPDGVPKVKGEFAYSSDMWADGMLWGATLRSPHPRARIRKIEISAALAVPGSMLRHIAIGEIDLRIVLGITLGGIPAVLVAAFLVQSMPVALLRWLVIVVVLYAAGVMLRAALRGRRGAVEPVECSEA